MISCFRFFDLFLPKLLEFLNHLFVDSVIKEYFAYTINDVIDNTFVEFRLLKKKKNEN